MKRTPLTASLAVIAFAGTGLAASRARADSPASQPLSSALAVPPSPAIDMPVPPPPPVLPPEPAMHRSWYGWQILSVDALSFLVVDPNAGTAAIPIALWVGSGPVIHALHGSYGRALGSAALRAGLPLLGAVVGAGMADCSGAASTEDDVCGASEMAIGGLVGMAAAEVIDTADLAYDDTPDAPSDSRAPRTVMVPGVAVTPNGVSASFLMTF